MYVIADIEWVETKKNAGFVRFPTQIAAVKIDENWSIISEFSSLIKPENNMFDRKHIAFTGGTVVDFYCANPAREVLRNFYEWLDKDDIIIWWHGESENMLKFFIKKYLKTRLTQKTLNIRNQVHALLGCGSKNIKGVYELAQAAGVKTMPQLKHFAKNDARVLYELLKGIGYTPEQLITFGSLPSKARNSICPPTPKTLREKNAELIKRTRYTYVYTPTSDIFHKPTCPRILGAKKITGVIKYKSIEALSKTPCKVCNPAPTDAYAEAPDNLRRRLLKKINVDGLPKDERRAVIRQREAFSERERLLKKQPVTETEKNDIYTLTQPRFAFFAGAGYSNFHLYGCQKLCKIADIRGFSLYSDAVFAGYTPCKFCKPSKKQNIVLSIPIDSQIRIGERVADLEPLCDREGYAYRYESEFFCIETPAGKWKLDVTSSPVRLEHINLIKSPDCKEYHKQPRVFLSFLDTFNYIKRHDEDLEKKHSEGKILPYFEANV